MQPHFGGYVARPGMPVGARPVLPGNAMSGLNPMPNMYLRPPPAFNTAPVSAPVPFRPVAPVVAPRPPVANHDDDYD